MKESDLKGNLPEVEGRLAWFCSYVPEELIRAAGLRPYRALPSRNNSGSTGFLPANLCPYVRQAAERILKEENESQLRGAVVAHSCNAMMHLYNVLEREADLPVFLLDLPAAVNSYAHKYMLSCLEKLADFLNKVGGEISHASLLASIKMYARTAKNLKSSVEAEELSGFSFSDYLPGFINFEMMQAAQTRKRAKFNNLLKNKGENALDLPAEGAGVYILTGAQPHREIVDLLSTSKKGVFHEHCSGFRYWFKDYQGALKALEGKEAKFQDIRDRSRLLAFLTELYLGKPRCPRFYDNGYRKSLYRKLLETLNIRGVIFHNLNFCDYAHYDFIVIKKLMTEANIPVLNLATELSSGDSGRIRTRLEAFMEMT
ncbi:2-hydroxyacyl-CoA dehydratase subunit D [Halarsenatibacter silvermanii]|uniref:Benzoyl-CoA reductase/2-hydroxyglutaryl-CoA dehydratase subunit, BcrC/BadD/HgdB n=1 Tax=Halarsenatibacter silvermanii TaxID=321763 RepID=A0A1G9KI59_9FIRM|nr:2-hydroxyacyl-CoA dehydratase family protein [Halarsenatibacter silvermanii]SDL49488.1 Benzoyl-CoA reductase/2-hydroxyglutaryl-CoA dehydratase subunit, BcrC/BadD/HgdB [Halarsenatibacter silvermanii]